MVAQSAALRCVVSKCVPKIMFSVPIGVE